MPSNISSLLPARPLFPVWLEGGIKKWWNFFPIHSCASPFPAEKSLPKMKKKKKSASKPFKFGNVQNNLRQISTAAPFNFLNDFLASYQGTPKQHYLTSQICTGRSRLSHLLSNNIWQVKATKVLCQEFRGVCLLRGGKCFSPFPNP